MGKEGSSLQSHTQVPAEDELFKIERLGMEPVQDADRHGQPRELAFVWAGAMVNYVSLLTGALVIGAPVVIGASQEQLGLLDCALAIVVGSALAALLHGLLSVTGARTGTPQMIFARGVFGHRGAYVGAALTWLMAIGWFAVDCIIGGWALVQLLGIFGLPRTTGVSLGALSFVLVASVIVAIYGHQTVHVFEKYGSMVFMAFCLLLFIVLLPRIHWDFPTTVHGLPRLSALVVGGSFIYALIASWLPFASDYSRYMPRSAAPRRIAWWSGLGIGLPTAVLGIVGVAFYTINPANPDLLSTITAASPPWLTVPFLLFVVLVGLGQLLRCVYCWFGGAGNGYSCAALGFGAAVWPCRRYFYVWDCALSRFNRAQTYNDLTTNFLSFDTDFLLLTYLWVPAWAAVLLIDFFVLRKGRYLSTQLTAGRGGRYWYRGGVFWRAVSAWFIGFVVTIPFISSATLPWLSTPWQGPLAHLLGGMDFSGIIGAVVSGTLYYLLARTGARPFTTDSL